LDAGAATPDVPISAAESVMPSDTNAIAESIVEQLRYCQATTPGRATRNDWYMALARIVRDQMMDRYISGLTRLTLPDSCPKVVSYLSAEFLLGPHLGNSLINLGLWEAVEEAIARLGQDLPSLLAQEEEPGLGNGGLGRLAACYMDSMATLGVPAIGYGIRYEFGIFDQAIRDGWQVELTDKWLRFGNPWEIVRPEISVDVKLGGHTEHGRDDQGRHRVRWVPQNVVTGVAHDTPIPGYRAPAANLLRLWRAEAAESFDLEAFTHGDYYGAVHQKVASETISKVLYPNDEPEAGKQLRLEQQYFFVSCSLQDMIRLQMLRGGRLDEFHKHWAVQLNDTHPSIAVAELMRLLLDDYQMGWEQAWDVTVQACAYTNHTLLAEALEKWPLPLFARVLPRHLEIIYEINRRFLDAVRASHPGDEPLAARLSLVDEAGVKHIRMAHLAAVGSHAVNGVAALHTELLQKTVMKDFHTVSPEKFVNVTNGVTPRRWIALSNPRLADLITRHIGDRWLAHLEEELPRLEPLADDAGFQTDWQAVKAANKRDLARLIAERTGVVVDSVSLFDVQVKRLHEYKRQHLNVLYLVTMYGRIKQGLRPEGPPRTVVFGGKAAPGYRMAKLIIRLITGVADVINRDPDVAGHFRVAFVPDFNVTNAQRIYPAADLSEQISTAGKEASGTGNMKFAMNGAVTIGTLDGANVEIRDAVGHENFFRFGLTAAEVAAWKLRGYSPMAIADGDAELNHALDLIRSGLFAGGDANLFRPLVDSLLTHDEYMVLADYRAYVDCQARVGEAFLETGRWARMSILNSARVGRFSSDRSIKDYCRDIWHVRPGANES
jgi:starch phosphorylase